MEKSGKLLSIIVAYGTRSTLPDALVAAYQRAIFAFWWMVTPQTDGPGFVEFKLGDYVEQLDAIFQMTGHDTAALITASNSKGVALSDAENGDRHGLLKRALEQRQLSSVRAYGRDPDGGWKPEDSLLVPGLSLEAAIELGRAFDQNAIVWSDESFTPRLVLLR